VEIMRQGYDALAREDFEAILELMDPQIEIHDRPEAPDARSYHGHEGVLTALGLNLETFEELRFEPEQFIADDDQIVVIVRLHGRGKVSGAPVEDRIAHHWSIRDGKAVRLQVFSDPSEALRAAGLAQTS
jgi:ketosteroid isomerase-like protein